MAAAAASSFTHPRRRAANPDADALTESLANMSLRKGLTFHTPAINDSDLLDPFEELTLSVPRSMTARSTTCPKELEDLLVGAGERRVVDFLARVDEAVNNKSKEQLGSILSEPDVLPVPAFLVEGATINDVPDETEDQAYDSGLGSSISDSDEGTIKVEEENKSTAIVPCTTSPSPIATIHLLTIPSFTIPRYSQYPIHNPPFTTQCLNTVSQYSHSNYCRAETSNKPRKSSRSGSAITRSISSVGSDTDSTNHLSQFAVEQIHRYLIKPILNEPALKDFHKLVNQVPRRIGDRQITNLRDLEKTLIFLAPVSIGEDAFHLAHLLIVSVLLQDYSRSPAAYLQFCETSIHCLHATANGVHESDQRLPTDRPYTNHYFLDLVQQIRRYAQILAANRKRQAAGEDVDDMEMTP